MYHTLSVEAPITKVIHILMSARESSPLYIAQALDKVQKASKNAFLKVQLNYLAYNKNIYVPGNLLPVNQAECPKEYFGLPIASNHRI